MELTVKKHRPFTLWLLMFFLLLLGIGGIYGGIIFLLDPSGNLMGLPPEFLPRLPVPDYTLPGIFLLAAMGIAPLVLLYGLVTRPRWRWTNIFTRWSGRHWSWTGTLYLGIGLALWLAIEGVLIGFSAPMQFITAFIGISILLLVLTPPVRRYFRAT
jgi:hypothetical protein